MTPGAQERIRFWMHNAEMAAVALRKVAPDGDYSNLVVIVADMRDELACMIVEALGKGDDVPAHAAKIEKRGDIPTGLLVLEVEVTRGIMATIDHPGVAKGLATEPPHGHVRAIVISSGAAMLMHPPLPKVPPVGQT